jgi:hypothetical protein
LKQTKDLLLKGEGRKKKMKSKIVLLMTLMLLASMMPAFQIAFAAEGIWLEPASSPPGTPSLGYKWNVTVWITSYNNPNVFAYQVKLNLGDDSMLNITNAWRPNWDNRWIFFGDATVGTAPSLYDLDHDGSNEGALVGDSLLGGAGEIPPPEPALLAIFEIEIIRAPTKFETLTTSLNINNVDTFVLDDALNSRSPPTTDGTYTWAWVAPTTHPDVAIRPESKVFDQYTNWTNFVFIEQVYIENLDIGWALTSADLWITYNSPDAILLLLGVVLNPAWAGPGNNVDTSTPGEIHITVYNHPAPFGNVLVANITFRIIYQGINPPQTAANVSDLTLHDVLLYDHVGPITYHALINGKVTVYPYLVIPLPWFEVVPNSVTLGPDLVVGDQFGKTFEVDIVIKGLHGTWKAIGWNLRLTYDPTLMEVVSVEEGPFWQDPRWDRYGTYFIANLDDQLPTDLTVLDISNIAMGDLLVPSSDGEWHRYPGLWNEEIVVENFTSPLIQPLHLTSGLKWHEIGPAYMSPSTKYLEIDYSDNDTNGVYSVGDMIRLNDTLHGTNGWVEWYTIKDVTYVANGGVRLTLDQVPTLSEGVIAKIIFRPIAQSWTTDYTTTLEIYPLFPPTNYIIDKDFNEVPVDESKIKNCDYTIEAIAAVGRRIDLWMVNPPNTPNGQGLHQYADLVVPQTEITLTAKVTYNWWPVQYKKVTFEVRDNHGALWAVLQGDTDDEGHAYATYRMPWPCQGAEGYLGKWNVTVSVTLADVVITDWMTYDYDYLIRIVSVAVDKPEYVHGDTVSVTVTYKTKLMSTKYVVMAVTITDELGVPFGVALLTLKVGGAAYCTYKTAKATVEIPIPKWAYAGLATVHVSFLSALPTQGGEAVAQELDETFYILPL